MGLQRRTLTHATRPIVTAILVDGGFYRRRAGNTEWLSTKTCNPKKLLAGRIAIEDLSERDFELDIVQKGVDMRIGLDIASLAERQFANQIIMISGDSDFVPAAKHARRSGIDFILDPMWAKIAPSLSEHVDGIRQCVLPPPDNLDDPLHVKVDSEEADFDDEA
ncbi:NYN domain-containing protein [Arcanobacterium phocae]|uniref:NYN domain-containing protein n=1 Tax=Arcanobacterium phocae TaxID=131112 RepID=UPI001C0ED663|nr:NYN domain-containing protein [Arcanobacterium phocae]